MSEEEYQKRLRWAVRGIPEEFLGWLMKMAQEQGRSGGHEEIIRVAGEMAFQMGDAIAAYTKRVTRKKGKPE